MRISLKRSNDLEKLIQIVRESWDYLAEDIATGKTRVYEEADIELELGYILKDKGLYVNRQHSVCLGKSTSKTSSGNAIVDLYTELSNKNNSFIAGIELKYPRNGKITGYREQIMKDIENLEVCIENGLVDVGFCLVYTKDRNYMSDKRSRVKINNTGYETDWLTFNNETDCFLTIVVVR